MWACPGGHPLPLAYPNPDIDKRICPACHHRTLGPGRLLVEKAASASTKKKYKETIPYRLSPASRSAARGVAGLQQQRASEQAATGSNTDFNFSPPATQRVAAPRKRLAQAQAELRLSHFYNCKPHESRGN